MEYFITPIAQPVTVVLNISWLENIFLETAILTNLNRRPRIEAEARGLLMPACVNDKSGLGRRYLSIWNKKGVNIFSIYQLSHGQFCGLLLFCSMQGVIGNSRHAVSRKKLGWKVPAVSFQGFPVVWPVTSSPSFMLPFLSWWTASGTMRAVQLQFYWSTSSRRMLSNGTITSQP